MILSSKTTNHSLFLFIRLTGFPAEKIFCRGSYFMPPEGQPSFYATRGTTWLAQRSFYSTRGTAKARPNMPGSEVGRRPASRFLNLGKNNSYLGKMIKNNSYPAETHKSNQQLGSKSIFLITLERIVPWRIVKSLLNRPDKEYLLTTVETSGETLCRDNCQLIGMPFFYTRSAGKNNRN